MSKRKGLSHEEKRQKILELFYEKKDFFQLKELERLGPKEKGVISQSVKDVVQSLVDDGLVDTDKIGTSIYFWAFPSKAFNTRKRKLDLLNNTLNVNNKRKKDLDDNVREIQVGREETADRTAILDKLSNLEMRKEKVLSEIKNYKDSDPDTLEEMKKEIKIAIDATNRWTDNIFSIKSWCKKKFFIEEVTLDKQFNIPEGLDYIDAL